MVDEVKTWLEYINEEAAKFGLLVAPMLFAEGQFAHMGVFRDGVLIIDAALGQTREAVEAFIAGCAWTRDGM